MCGIIGINCNSNLKNNLDKSLIKLGHRGPDSSGFFISLGNDTLIGHTRLAILDLSANGHQPMLDTTNRFVISYNGEIYNFLDLKNYLNKKYGLIDWKTNTDTEVLLQGFAKEKEKFFSKLNGIYSFIIYDKKTKYFHVLRDPIGIKPLYYTLQNGSFYCASELSGLTCLSGLSKSLRVQSFADQIAHMYIPEPFTIYNEFFKLEPGLYQTYFNGKKIAHQKISYECNKVQLNFYSENDIIDEFRQKLNKARSEDRKSKIGTGDRSERIRTYNFPQGRVTDHRINLTLHKLNEFMEGEIFDEMVESLSLQAQEEELENLN